MASSVPSAPRPDTQGVARRPWRRRLALGVFVLIVVAIVVPPFINIGRFRPRIAGALGRSLGRQVSIGDVELQLLPAPGLKLSRVVVEDDPAFSREPMLRADQVTASLRIASLWRGRLEIARLTFESPSFNLVRRPDGHWNLESLLERARQTAAAPTARTSAGVRPRFPYIEFDAGRINLKMGEVKTVYSLSEADFAIWSEREHEWDLRLSAQPIRTDANLGDTGTISLSGTIRRGTSLSDMPLDLHFRLERGQLGQITTLIYGRDRGWRGALNVVAALKGTPAALSVRASASVDDFTRYDIADRTNLRLATSCAAMFHSPTQVFDNVQCTSPVNNGVIVATGQVAGILPVQSFDFVVSATSVPASAVAMLVRHMKKDLPPDVSATGEIGGQFSVHKAADGEPQWEGTGSAKSLTLRSDRIEGPLALGNVRFGMAADQTTGRHHESATLSPPPASLMVTPFALDLGGNTPAHVQASFSRDGYRIGVTGDTRLKRLLEVSAALGVASPRFSPDGDAAIDLSISGEWAGFAQPLVIGSAKVRATVPVNGIGTPVQVNSAVVNLDPDGITVQHLEFGWPKAGVILSGSMQLPRRCTTIETCPVTFRLRSNTLDVADLNALLNPEMQKRPWYAFIETTAAKNPVLARVTASGTLNIGELTARGMTISNLAADASLKDGVLTLDRTTATAFDGKIIGSLRADFRANPPQFAARGSLLKMPVSALAGPGSRWGAGTLATDFAIDAAGLSTAALTKSATGSFHFDWRGGTLPGLDERAGTLRVADFHGAANLQGGQIVFFDSRMNAGGRIYAVSGTAALDRQLHLTLSRGSTPEYQITGTLDKPEISAASAAQAKLQP